MRTRKIYAYHTALILVELIKPCAYCQLYIVLQKVS